ncbi:endonuclease/exonuclease/phosphatase family protein [Sphingomonas sp. LHG3406-1]|uniref:endonuclease/exonuclease/phosphatase family protein n=1 Tax=Sphingomonas sp. LHG3406-1 TaxID=2804617 RepID=UPI0026065189|nr:endonuclease/exonuclease/phosphatase family protein [Sphingomonas sp. LHG3406-1]
MMWAKRVVWALGLLLAVATFLPIASTNEWWVRIFDFPRVQIAALIAIVLVTLVGLRAWRTTRSLLLGIALLVALAYQVVRIWPYTRFAEEEVATAPACPSADRLRLLEANVLQSNRDSAALLSLVREQRPDVLLLTETDDWWARQTQPLRADLPHVISEPRGNTYGMLLFSRLPLSGTQVRYLFNPDVPSIRTELVLSSGKRIDLYAIHPKPPLPGRDTGERDAEIVIVGREVRRRARPAIVAGDLNDVAWSDTTSLFQEVSGLLDPRVGRTLMPTYPADFPLLRWPLDYVFVSPGFRLTRMERLGDFGSDHLPVLVELCSAGVEAGKIEPPRLEAEVRSQVRETIDEAREERD